MSANVLFCLTNSSKPKDIQFTLADVKEKQKILTIGDLELISAWKIKTITRF